MKYINFLGIIALFSFMVACSPMDDKYSQFVEDGPITYLQKVNADSVVLVTGRNRIQISWPKSNDPRGKMAYIYWSNRMGKDSVNVNPNGRTSFVINNLNEGSYIFEIIIVDEDGNSSIPITVTGEVYGENYEKYLLNRAVSAVSITGDTALVTLAEVIDTNIISTEFKWKNSSENLSLVVQPSENSVKFENFKAFSFEYTTTYEPGIDQFKSPYSYYTINSIEPGDITYNRATKTFTFPSLPNDGNYKGIELRWTNDGETNANTYLVPKGQTTAVLTNYTARSITYRLLFDFETSDIDVYSSEKTKVTAEYSDFNRSAWISTQSHTRPTDAAITNAADSHIDGNTTSCLSLVKPGKSLSGVTVGANETVYFLLDMGSQQKIDYFRLRHRNTSLNLRVRSFSLYGSNNGTDYTPIKENIAVNYTNTALEEQQDLPGDSYRYIKFIYEGWDPDSGNTMQIAEFYLGEVLL